MSNLTPNPDDTAEIPAWDTSTPLLGGDGTAPLNRAAQALLNKLVGYVAKYATSWGASAIGFIQSGTGAVLRTIEAEFRDSVSVKHFGAKGDGATDDTAAIQAAIAFMNPNVFSSSFDYQQGGGTVRFPRGVYRTTSSIQIPPFVSLKGDGCDGWTGGGAGIGITGGTSKPNGSAIFADFGATTETCAIDTQNWRMDTGVLNPATNMTLITVPQLGGTFTYCQGVAIKDMAILCTNQTRVGVRLQAAALGKLENVSIIGFKNALLSNCVWSTEYRSIFSISYQTGISLVSNNAVKFSGVFDLSGWGSSDGTTITNNNVVTAINKPSWWSANDTNYNGTSIYAVGCFAIRPDGVTTQHCGRSWYAESADISFGMIYIEDLPFLSAGSTPGAFNAYNAAASNFSVTIDHLHSDSNGVTLFNNITNTPITLENMSGIQGNMLGGGVTGSSKLVLGNNVNRNVAFGDFAFDTRIYSIVPTEGVWVPGLTNIGGTGVTVSGKWVRRGNVYDITVTITGTALTATGGGASIISTPFNGSGGFPAPARASGASVTTANVQSASGLMDTNANLYVSAISSTTRIVVSAQMFAA